MASEEPLIDWVKRADGVIKNKEYKVDMYAGITGKQVFVRWHEGNPARGDHASYTKYYRPTDSAYDAVLEVYENWLRSK